MPLIKNKSKKAFEHNMKAEMEAGKPQKQALAIAYSVKRKPKKMAAGGSVQSGSRDMNMANGGVASIRPDKGFGKVIMMEAEGGEINAKNARRPMPDNIYDDSEMIRKNRGNKPSKQDSWTDNKTVQQAQSNNGRKVMPIARPKMVPTNAFSTRLYDKEGKLQESERPGPYGEQPEEDYNEVGPNRQGDKVRDMSDEHSTRSKPYKMEMEHDDLTDESKEDMRRNKGGYAKGGIIEESDKNSHNINMRTSMEPKDDTEEMYEREDQNDHMLEDAPSEDEGLMHADDLDEMDQDGHGDAVPDMEEPHNKYEDKVYGYADGGEIDHSADDSEMQPEDEEIMERHNSIAAAIMAKKAKEKELDSDSDDDKEVLGKRDGLFTFPRTKKEAKMSQPDIEEMQRLYNGGEIKSHDSIYSDDSDMADMSRNHDEDANEEDQLSFNALRKENYNSSNLDKSQPRNSNLIGDSEEEDSENKHDMISAIRAKMRKQRQF